MTFQNGEWYHVLIGVLETIVVYCALTFGQRFLRRFPLVRSMAVALNMVILCGAILLGLGTSLSAMHPLFLDAIMAAWLFFMACVALRVIDALVFGLINWWRQAEPIPIVLRDIGRWFFSMAILFLIIRLYFPMINFNILALSSIVIGYIVGNATQDTLGNLISGLALNTEAPFQIGDWVSIGGHTGMVADMTWRSTRLWTKNDDCIMIPNGSISKEPIVNYTRPSPSHGRTFQIGIDYRVPPNKVLEVIIRTLGEVEGIVPAPRPEVFLSSFGDSSIIYSVKYFITDFQHMELIESRALVRLWYAFAREGITIPYPIRDLRVHTITPESESRDNDRRMREILSSLKAAGIFTALPLPELEYMATRINTALYAAGEILVRQGEEGDSLYVIRKGSVAVRVTDNDKHETIIARLQGGSCFGEMSLLTGERRTATVTAECDTEVLVVSHAVLAAVLSRNAALAEVMADTLAKRTLDRQLKIDAANASGQNGAHQSAVTLLVQKIKTFFGLSGKTP